MDAEKDDRSIAAEYHSVQKINGRSAIGSLNLHSAPQDVVFIITI
ncbi:hypothetical protein [Dapis sp. BLCC M126]